MCVCVLLIVLCYFNAFYDRNFDQCILIVSCMLNKLWSSSRKQYVSRQKKIQYTKKVFLFIYNVGKCFIMYMWCIIFLICFYLKISQGFKHHTSTGHRGHWLINDLNSTTGLYAIFLCVENKIYIFYWYYVYVLVCFLQWKLWKIKSLFFFSYALNADAC